MRVLFLCSWFSAGLLSNAFSISPAPPASVTMLPDISSVSNSVVEVVEAAAKKAIGEN